MTRAVLGIIGGSGIYDLPGLEDVREETIKSPWGEPSAALTRGVIGGLPIAFLPRHGKGHVLSPSDINYRANIDVLKRAGVTDLVSLSACGSFREELPPGTFVLVDQFVDRTYKRESSFFGRGCVAHVSMAHPVSPRLHVHLVAAAKAEGIEAVQGGTYVCMEGPQFSSLAESLSYKAQGYSVIGMTNMPEAKLAREAEICYASVAMVTDFDCWHPDHDAVTVQDIIRVLNSNAGKAKGLVARLARDFPREHEPCPVGSDKALDTALITAPEARDPRLLARLDAVAGRGVELMKVDGRHFRSIWLEDDGWTVGAIDQRRLPHEFVVARLVSAEDATEAIRSMLVRGAPLIGATAAYGMALAMRADASDAALDRAYAMLLAARPTAINLKWALDEMARLLRPLPASERTAAAYKRAVEIADEDVAINQGIGRHGLALIEQIAAGKRPGEPVNVLTHCNAGWLATVDWGTATAPIYLAHDRGLKVHVWVDETRPRNQGASLTAWELGHHGVPHTVIPDNTGGHLMQHCMVDLAIVGTDRVAANGDVCNKIGTYLKALAAHDNGVPFYVALPSPTIDFSIDDGIRQIPIEQRSAGEVANMTGRTADGRVETVRVVPEGSPVANYAFDVTPARLVTGLITERGLLRPERAALASAFPERSGGH